MKIFGERNCHHPLEMLDNFLNTSMRWIPMWENISPTVVGKWAANKELSLVFKVYIPCMPQV